MHAQIDNAEEEAPLLISASITYHLIIIVTALIYISLGYHLTVTPYLSSFLYLCFVLCQRESFIRHGIDSSLDVGR
ncbi:hypothetical protein HYPSUDRAFT_1001274 [Hypholoma sublateritium FD-334 SS-4]|uniref:Uncharacterized protein n=1 Tax=Hypholoma sublateritium (strain FD-334 SS-4) TaxID=945553 RepID=A0A0D2NFL8_HYPSF|nr:hypothetical protein HYPSUDRAFT_1001274 [Hypholoma sublateritium FD-334 SS-4]